MFMELSYGLSSVAASDRPLFSERDFVVELGRAATVFFRRVTDFPHPADAIFGWVIACVVSLDFHRQQTRLVQQHRQVRYLSGHVASRGDVLEFLTAELLRLF